MLRYAGIDRNNELVEFRDDGQLQDGDPFTEIEFGRQTVANR